MGFVKNHKFVVKEFSFLEKKKKGKAKNGPEKMRKNKGNRWTREDIKGGCYKEQLKVSCEIIASMKSASTARTEFNSLRKNYLEDVLLNPKSEVNSNLLQYRGTRGRMCGATFPLNKHFGAKVIDECGAVDLTNEDVKTILRELRRRSKSKLLQFCENRRPAYWGTWGQICHSVGPRRPFSKEDILDYNVDSDDEWEEGVEQIEILSDSEGEGEEKEPANNNYKIDYLFTVPHGYLSEEEIPKGENEVKLWPSTVTELSTEEEKPSVIGCCWSDHLNPKSHAEVLQHHAAVVLLPSSAIPIKLTGEIDGTVRKKKSSNKRHSNKHLFDLPSKRYVSDESMPALIRLLHGSTSKPKTVKKFQLYLASDPAPKGKKALFASHILNTIAKIASLDKCTEEGPLKGKMCYFVHEDVLERYNLPNLSVNGQGNLEIGHQDEKARSQSRRIDKSTRPHVFAPVQQQKRPCPRK